MKTLMAKCAILVAASTAVALPASATVIDVTFSGVFNRLNNGCSPYTPSAPGNCTSSPIATGLSGSFSYSTGASFPILGGTVTSDAFSAVGRATTLTSTGPYGSVNLPIPGNNLAFNDILGSLFFENILSISLAYPSSVTLDPASPPPFLLAQSASVRFVTSGSPGGTGPSLDGFITGFSAVNRAFAVPEPGTWLSLLAGIGMAGALLRRTRRLPTLRIAAS